MTKYKSFNKDTQRLISTSTKNIVCKSCKKGHGSELDGLCTKCRGCTAWEQRQKESLQGR